MDPTSHQRFATHRIDDLAGPPDDSSGLPPSPDGRLASSAPALHWSFPAAAMHVHQARRWLGIWLTQQWGANSDAAERAALAFDEVAANGVAYGGGGPVTVDACLDEGVLRCEVADASPALPQARAAAEDEERGRGLQLVDVIVDRWDTHRLQAGTGKVVWFEIIRDKDSQ